LTAGEFERIAPMPQPRLNSVQTGGIAALGPDLVPSGFVKQDRSGQVAVTFQGLEGDRQADLSAHGGPEKAVYGYASAHYPAWSAEFPALAASFRLCGALGENLTIAGLEERDICVGDVHAIGSALLQVCQPRQPCFKLALRHNEKKLPKAMVRSGRAGWYYRVLQEGELSAGDAVVLQDRPHPEFAFTRLIEIVYYGKATRAELLRMTQMPELASQWREAAMMRLG
jgi:MOSC domain-containing protein YiiM